MAPFVHDFEHGNKDARICWGQGANPRRDDQPRYPGAPGFTIDTDACRAYLAAGPCPNRWPRRSTNTWRPWKARPADGSGTPMIRPWCRCARREVLDAGMMETVLNVGLNDESVEGLGHPDREMTAVGLLPATAPDVREDRARSEGGTLRGRDGRDQEGQGRDRRPRPRHRRPGATSSREIIREDSGAEFHRIPRPNSWGRRGRLQLVELRPRRPLPPP